MGHRFALRLWPALLALLLAGAPLSGSALDPEPERAPAAAEWPAAAARCADLASADRRLVHEFPLPLSSEVWQAPVACLLFERRAGLYAGALIGVDGLEAFRAAKAVAVDRARTAGLDPCTVVVWKAYGRFAAGAPPTPDDQYAAPVVCAPRVRAVPSDATAARLLPQAEAALSDVRAAIDRVITAPSNRPLQVYVAVERGPTVEFFRRYYGDPDLGEARARAGRSTTGEDDLHGPRIIVNLSAYRGLTDSTAREAVTAALLHEYIHHAQAVAGGARSSFPAWYIDGQALFIERAGGLAGASGDDLRLAVAGVGAGTAIPLRALATREDWLRAEGDRGVEQTYARSLAAYAYLVERYGPAAMVRLLTENRNGDPGRFEILLYDLTGANSDGLDAVVDAWLRGLVWQTAAAGGAPLWLQFRADPAAQTIEGRIILARDLPCLGGGRVASAGSAYPFVAARRPDGTFEGRVFDVSAHTLLRIDQLGPRTMTGAFRLVHRDGDPWCDTGAVPFALPVPATG